MLVLTGGWNPSFGLGWEAVTPPLPPAFHTFVVCGLRQFIVLTRPPVSYTRLLEIVLFTLKAET